MTRAQRLPDHLRNRPFTVAEAREAGLGRSRMRAGDLISPTRGVRVVSEAIAPIPSDETPTQRMDRLRDDLRRRARYIAPALASAQFFWAETAVAVLGGPLPYTTASTLELHVAARRPAGRPRRAGVVGHLLPAREPARWQTNGLPIEAPCRAWAQLAASWQVDDLVALGDHLVLPEHRLLTIEELRAEARRAGALRPVLERALADIRVGAESPKETELRLFATRAGLPEPLLQHVLRTRDGRTVARLDLAWPQFRVASEYDGRQHAEGPQFARDADRWDDIRRCGWVLVRVLSHHLHPDPQVAVDRISAALWDAGWRPGR